MIICVPNEPDQKWEVGDPPPRLSGAVTKIYIASEELVVFNALVYMLSRPRILPLKKTGMLRAEGEIRRQLEIISVLANHTAFSEQELAQVICHTLSWCLGMHESGPMGLFGWIRTNLKELMESLNGQDVTTDSVLGEIMQIQEVKDALNRIGNVSQECETGNHEVK